MKIIEDAVALPLAFAQVREDSLLDIELLRDYQKPAVLMIGSGGCTLAALLGSLDLSRVDVVDPNPAQQGIIQLKLAALWSLDTHARLKVFGHEPMDKNERKAQLETLAHESGGNLELNVIAPLDLLYEVGPDFCGRYERLFLEMQGLLAHKRPSIQELFRITTLPAQLDFYNRELRDEINQVLDQVMELSVLVKLFGQEATANPVQTFAEHFKQQTNLLVDTQLVSSNPWFSQFLQGQFTDVYYPWFSMKTPAVLPSLEFHFQMIDDFLRNADGDSYHFIHLSNVLDWLSLEAAEQVLNDAYRALKPGGVMILRQLNSNLKFEEMSSFNWERKAGGDLLASDRSFFYRNLFIGRKNA